MSDLVSLERAAELLGVTTDELNDMRLKNEIFGTRDGASWKFKMDEVERVASDRGVPLDDDDSDFELSDGSAELSLSDSAELIESDSSIDEIASEKKSDILLSEDDDELSFGTSDIALASGSDENVLSDEEPSEKGSPSDTGKLLADSGDLELSEDDLFDDDLTVQQSPGLVDSSDLSSDFEDSDLVLEDSDSSEEPAMEEEAAESGINLSPNESGISLEESFDLGGSDIDDLELPDDNEVIALEESAGADSTTLLKSDDDFNLTPLEDDALEDSSSGSQVIALEDSAIYTDDSTPTTLEGAEQTYDDAAPKMLDAPIQPEAAVFGAVAPAPEAPYTLVNILSLALAFVVVLVGTMVAFDIARNMWQPTGITLSSTIADFFVNLGGFEP